MFRIVKPTRNWHHHWRAGAAGRNLHPDRALVFRASPKQYRHLLGELGTDPALLMLEINERIFPHRFLFADEIGPAANVGLLIIFAPEAKVAVVGGDFLRRAERVGVGNAKGDV